MTGLNGQWLGAKQQNDSAEQKKKVATNGFLTWTTWS